MTSIAIVLNDRQDPLNTNILYEVHEIPGRPINFCMYI